MLDVFKGMGLASRLLIPELYGGTRRSILEDRAESVGLVLTCPAFKIYFFE